MCDPCLTCTTVFCMDLYASSRSYPVIQWIGRRRFFYRVFTLPAETLKKLRAQILISTMKSCKNTTRNTKVLINLKRKIIPPKECLVKKSPFLFSISSCQQSACFVLLYMFFIRLDRIGRKQYSQCHLLEATHCGFFFM